ncbi:MAG TPA: tetratricopeptide repeat protein, partial [Terriglobales bacterium]|nr:tetratricopeptide repeat protein [Terriglobales bacterium]
MPKSTRLLPLLLVLFSLSAFADQTWVEVRSPHFAVITDAGPKAGRDIALRFEQMRTVFGQIFRRSKISLPVPLQIVAFRNGKEMRPFVPLFNGKPVELAGLFQGGEDRSYILLDLGADNKFETVFHEYAHQLLNGNFPRMAPWFDEGFAQYFAAMQITGNSFSIGEAPAGALEMMSRTRLMPVATLFTVAHQSETYNRSGDPRHLFYSESWLMVHMLFDRNRLKQADDYFHLVNDEHLPVEQAIQKAFTEDPKQLDKELADYLNSGRGKFLGGQVAEKFDVNSFTATPVDAMDLRVTLADVHFHSPDHRAQAAKEYEQILAEKPNVAAAHRGLGYAYLYDGDFDKALEHFHQAARLSTTDPRVYYFSALVIARRSMTAGRPSAEDLAAMKADLQKAIALDPAFADAYSVLGFANMFEADYPSALSNCKKAADLNPRSEIYALNLGRAYLMAGKANEAKEVLEKVKDS